MILTCSFVGIIRGSPEASTSNFCIIKTPRSIVYNYQPYHRTTRATTTTTVANGTAVSDTCHHVVVAIPISPIQLPVYIHATILVLIPSKSLTTLNFFVNSSLIELKFQTLIFLATRTRAVFSPLFSVLYKLLLDPLHRLLTMFASVLWMILSPILSIIFK